MKYIFKYKKGFFWKRVTAAGHKLEENRMIVFLDGGGVLSIPGWDKTTILLGPDFDLEQRKAAEKEAGQKLVFTKEQ